MTDSCGHSKKVRIESSRSNVVECDLCGERLYVPRWFSDTWETVWISLVPVALIVGVVTFSLWIALFSVAVCIGLAWLGGNIVASIEWRLFTPRRLSKAQKTSDAIATRVFPIALILVLVAVYYWQY